MTAFKPFVQARFQPDEVLASVPSQDQEMYQLGLFRLQFKSILDSADEAGLRAQLVRQLKQLLDQDTPRGPPAALEELESHSAVEEFVSDEESPDAAERSISHQSNLVDDDYQVDYAASGEESGEEEESEDS